jgi:hypothetical protein
MMLVAITSGAKPSNVTIFVQNRTKIFPTGAGSGAQESEGLEPSTEPWASGQKANAEALLSRTTEVLSHDHKVNSRLFNIFCLNDVNRLEVDTYTGYPHSPLPFLPSRQGRGG